MMKTKQNLKRTAALALALMMALGLTATGFARSLIGTEKAKEIAYKDAGIQAADVSAIDTLNYHREGNLYVYKFVFRTASAKYVYRINAASGGIISGKRVDFDGDNKNHDKDRETVNSVVITAEEALAIAMKQAGITASDIKKKEVELDRDDGRMIYEVEIKTYGSAKYEYDIDAETGKVIGGDSSGTGSTLITTEKALSIALSHAGLSASSVRKQEIKLDKDDGHYVYEIEFKAGRDTEYEFEIDAYTGKVLKYEIDD